MRRYGYPCQPDPELARIVNELWAITPIFVNMAPEGLNHQALYLAALGRLGRAAWDLNEYVCPGEQPCPS